MKLYNGCNILVTTAPCLKELLTKSANAIKSEKLKCIAFENLDCIMKKHADICNDIIKELCVKKGDVRQIIVTSRTWKPFLGKFMNEKVMAADSVLIIGNYLEAALWGGVSLEFILSKAEEKLANLTSKQFFTWNFCLLSTAINNYCFQNKSRRYRFDPKELWSFVTSLKRPKLWQSIFKE